MPYKTILVHLHDRARASVLLEAAVPLARAMEAHLIGLNVLPPYIIIPTMDGAGATTVVEEHRTAYRAEASALKAAFAAATADMAGRCEWREDDAGYGAASKVLIEHGRACDLIVLSRKQHEWTYSTTLEEPDAVAMEVGRPVLIVPERRGAWVLPPRRATVAWNGRREAARAAFDAVPLLARTQETTILSVAAEAAGDLPGSDIAGTLSRHGITCRTTAADAKDGDVGRELLRQAAADGSDLLVMGCYGHSRLREHILGGASNHVLAHAPLPVLMSH